MKFAIRDDDTCRHSDPSVLTDVYGDYWDEIPVSLACVPMVSADADVVLDFDTDRGAHSIAENTELVSSLRSRIEDEQIEISLHGYHHDTPSGKPEFVGGEDLHTKVKEGKRILEETFHTDVTTFVPPHVRLSNRGVRAVAKEDMDLIRGFGPRPREFQFHHKWPLAYSKILALYLKHGKKFRYPYPLDFGTHREIYCHRINKYTDVEEVKSSFNFIQKHDGVFVISVHAYGLQQRGRENLEEIITYALERGVEPATLRDLFS